MKDYKILRTYAAVGEAGNKVPLPDDKFTRSMLELGIIAEIKVVEPNEKKTRKPRAKKAD